MSGKGVDQINLFKLVRYLQESKLARKVEGYAVHAAALTSQTNPNTAQTKPESTAPVLHQISSLLSALTHPSKEGRLFYSRESLTNDARTICLKFLLLDPSTHFEEIVSEARYVNHEVLLGVKH